MSPDRVKPFEARAYTTYPAAEGDCCELLNQSSLPKAPLPQYRARLCALTFKLQRLAVIGNLKNYPWFTCPYTDESCTRANYISFLSAEDAHQVCAFSRLFQSMVWAHGGFWGIEVAFLGTNEALRTSIGAVSIDMAPFCLRWMTRMVFMTFFRIMRRQRQPTSP